MDGGSSHHSAGGLFPDAVTNNNNIATNTQRPSSRRSSFLHPTRLSSLSPPQRQQEKPFSVQNRRLQLRNAGFRAALLPTRKLSPQFTGWRSISGESDRGRDKENDGSAVTDRVRSLSRGTTPQTRRSSILREINNSTQRRYRQSPRPPAASLFHDLPSPEPSTDDFSIYSPSKHTGQLGPPIDLDTFDYTDPDTTMKSKTSPSPSAWRSPFNSLDRPKRRKTAANRTSDLEVSRYIEHLEEQLAASLDRAESVDSSASNVQAAKFKALNAEYKILKQELAEWEAKFEIRVKDELGGSIEKESEFRAKIRALERDVEAKDNKIREQEWEIEMATQKLRNLEAVNSTNRSLERRVDVLTELLAQSPSRGEPSSAFNRTPDIASPQEEGVYRTPRPRSMFSKIPLSPIRRPLFQPLPVPESNSLDQIVNDGEVATEQRDGYIDENADIKSTSELMSLDSGLGDSCSSPSTRAPESQRFSMISQSSSNSSLWGTSFPLSPDGQGKFSSRQKRMRRFPPGSCTLKPLLLPATSPHVPAGQGHSRSLSGDSIPHSRLHSNRDSMHSNYAWMEADTLSALEGRSNQYQSFDDAINDHRAAIGFSPLEGNHSDYAAMSSSRIFFDDAHPCAFTESPTYDTDTENEPTKKMLRPASSRDIHNLSIPSTRTRYQAMRRIDRDMTPRGKLDSRIANTRNISTATGMPTPINGKWESFYYTWDSVPTAATLVRRILANAWHANWKKLGKLSWWVLGLFLGGQPRNEWLRNRIRGQACHNHTPVQPRHPRNQSNFGSQLSISEIKNTPGRLDTTVQLYDTSKPKHEPYDLNVTDGQLSSLGSRDLFQNKFQAWAKFSFALVLAIGLAVRDGPVSLMDECLVKGQCTPTAPTTKPPEAQSTRATPDRLPVFLSHTALDYRPGRGHVANESIPSLAEELADCSPEFLTSDNSPEDYHPDEQYSSSPEQFPHCSLSPSVLDSPLVEHTEHEREVTMDRPPPLIPINAAPD
ncbi:hypothetical protein FQN53_001968 [Emmonsiellopsis sp. PD_33]|nr:hypothetical protein FQN53_001968 [Emmonsiellopsis sp. PD_33]KAK2806381.1 hypothetical protein FQN51_007425 [Onygenales sp. PD_10]